MAARSSKKKTPEPTGEPAPEAHVEPQLAVMPGAIAEFSKTEAGLAEIRSRLQGRVFDVTTTEGMKEAKEARRELVSLRTSLEAKRKDVKEDALRLCKRIDSEAARVRTAIVELEDPIDSQIKAREQAIEDARAEKIRAERAEATRVQKVLDDLRNTPVVMTGKSADLIRAAIEDLEGKTFGDMPEAAANEAAVIGAAARDRLVVMLDERIAIDAEREELDAQRKRQDEAEARSGYERQIAAIKALPSDVYDSPGSDIAAVLQSLTQRRFDTWPDDLAAQASAATAVARDRLQSRLDEKHEAENRERERRESAAREQTVRDFIDAVRREPTLALSDQTAVEVQRRIERLESMQMPSSIDFVSTEQFKTAHTESMHALLLRHADLVKSEERADQEALERADAAKREAQRQIETTSLLDAARLALLTLKDIRPAILASVNADPALIPTLEAAISRAEKGASADVQPPARTRAKPAKPANRSRKTK